MRSVLLTVGACAAVVLVSGCRNTQVAGVRPSQEEEAWEKVIKRNYPNYRPPRAAAPAVVGNTEERVSAPVKSDLEPMDAPAEKTDAEPKAESKDAPEAGLEVTEPAKAEPAKAEPAKAEPAKAEPAKAEPAKAESAKAEPAKAEPAKAVEKKPAKVAPPDPTNSTVYEVRSGDTLGKISQKHYGSARYANVIFKANGDILKDANRLRPGMKLIIPKL